MVTITHYKVHHITHSENTPYNTVKTHPITQ